MDKIFFFDKTSESVEVNILPLRIGITLSRSQVKFAIGFDYLSNDDLFVVAFFFGLIALTITFDKDKRAYLEYFNEKYDAR